ncbi:MAG: hypothetical protein GQ581_04875 [Methyloprofundus sp.]|nr:hypothetical protein [Methyloprofundus sp.]
MVVWPMIQVVYLYYMPLLICVLIAKFYVRNELIVPMLQRGNSSWNAPAFRP